MCEKAGPVNEKRIYALCKEKGWVDPSTCLMVAKEIGVEKVIAILEAQPKAIRAGYDNKIGGVRGWVG